jgi:cytochrome c oxidase subunit 2
MGSLWSKTVDEKYLKFIMTNHDVWVVKGYPPIMPKMSLTEKEVDGIIAYIKTLKSGSKTSPRERTG